LSEKLIEDLKREPTKVLEKISNSISTLRCENIGSKITKKNLEMIKKVVDECKEIYTSESGTEIVLELRKNNLELKNELEKSERKNKSLQQSLEIQTLCMICMDRTRDTILMPLFTFPFIAKNAFKNKSKHQKTTTSNVLLVDNQSLEI